MVHSTRPAGHVHCGAVPTASQLASAGQQWLPLQHRFVPEQQASPHGASGSAGVDAKQIPPQHTCPAEQQLASLALGPKQAVVPAGQAQPSLWQICPGAQQSPWQQKLLSGQHAGGLPLLTGPMQAMTPVATQRQTLPSQTVLPPDGQHTPPHMEPGKQLAVKLLKALPG